MSPIPSRWKGECMPGGNSTYSFKCNMKVIGARYYDDPEEPGYIVTARDEHGHGTHVASIAAGKPVRGASLMGLLAKGIARGGSPGSRIAVYRACGADGRCMGSAIIKAFDDAIADGVDVLSISIGGHNNDLFTNHVAIGAFHAAEKGITVVCSAGNSGPSPGTLENFVPWVLTVGATTTDRDFEADIVLGGGNRKNIIIKGGGVNFPGLNKSSAVYPLVDGRSAGSNQHNVANASASNCVPGSLDGSKVKGKTVLCEDEDDFDLFLEKMDSLKKQGATGMIMINDDFVQDPYYYGRTPVFAAVTQGDGAQIRSYINSTGNPLAKILPTEVRLNHKPAPVVAYFSSRGPVNGIENLLKPDVAAPGVTILAAWPSFDYSASKPGPPIFNIISGTSQACPHVSGLAATVKSQHPTWSPSTIRSAIMTTAIPTNNLHVPITTITESRATPYDIGAGEISLFGPFCPGLVYETKITDYIQFLCNRGYNASVIKTIASTVPNNFSCPSNSSPDLISDMNYPSIAVSGLKANGKRTVIRTVTNVGEEYSTYTATVEAPASMQVQVVPNKLQFTKNVKILSFQVIFKLTKAYEEPLFGSVTLSNGKYKVRSPFVVSNA
ncbi:co(2)-response secreted protease [Phtheirospermum japonicum]|uniref:Co(2)-response secreted protease n=1 Tax=Phtheirospermum japonicum TaxID=374723 RepID=A0A830CN99_9LAMI|nr:co(2)-response secreted protease [Phtheirospermum japonicum]